MTNLIFISILSNLSFIELSSLVSCNLAVGLSVYLFVCRYLQAIFTWKVATSIFENHSCFSKHPKHRVPKFKQKTCPNKAIVMKTNFWAWQNRRQRPVSLSCFRLPSHRSETQPQRICAEAAEACCRHSTQTTTSHITRTDEAWLHIFDTHTYLNHTNRPSRQAYYRQNTSTKRILHKHTHLIDGWEVPCIAESLQWWVGDKTVSTKLDTWNSLTHWVEQK